jgi:3-dehydroquinate dehydratase-2
VSPRHRRLSPVAGEIEGQALRWITELVGSPGDGGTFVSGGSMASFLGFLASRAAADSWDGAPAARVHSGRHPLFEGVTMDRHRSRLGFLVLLAVVGGTYASAADTRQAPPPPLTVLVVHGPNLNLLGRREPEIYGSTTLAQINARLDGLAKELRVTLITLQSNSEAAIDDAFHQHIDNVDGALINAAGLTFSSVSIHDAIKAMSFPVIEVHISNLATRDEIHRDSILGPAVRGTVMGLGWRSYTAAMRALVEIVREDRAAQR